VLEYGAYDAIVVDANRVDDADDATSASLSIELAITSGARKGDVIALRTDDASVDALELLGLPATLIVEAGVPRVQFER